MRRTGWRRMLPGGVCPSRIPGMMGCTPSCLPYPGGGSSPGDAAARDGAPRKRLGTGDRRRAGQRVRRRRPQEI